MIEQDKTPTIGVLIHSFFVIPFVIAMVAACCYLFQCVC